MILGLRTVIYRADDLDRAKAWYREAFATEPYFDQPFYVGFRVAGFELGLDPDPAEGPAGPGGTIAYWGVVDVAEAFARFVELGASAVSEVTEVGDGIRVATVADPFGNLIGLIENPHFGKESP